MIVVLQVERVLTLANRFGVPSRKEERPADICGRLRGQRIQCPGLPGERDRLLSTSLRHEEVGQADVRVGVIGIEVQRAPEGLLGGTPLPFTMAGGPNEGVRFRQVGIQPQRLLRSRQRFRQHLRLRRTAAEDRPELTVRT